MKIIVNFEVWVKFSEGSGIERRIWVLNLFIDWLIIVE